MQLFYILQQLQSVICSIYNDTCSKFKENLLFYVVNSRCNSSYFTYCSNYSLLFGPNTTKFGVNSKKTCCFVVNGRCIFMQLFYILQQLQSVVCSKYNKICSKCKENLLFYIVNRRCIYVVILHFAAHIVCYLQQIQQNLKQIQRKLVVLCCKQQIYFYVVILHFAVYRVCCLQDMQSPVAARRVPWFFLLQTENIYFI